MDLYAANPECQAEGCSRRVKQRDWTFCGPCNYRQRTGKPARDEGPAADHHTFDGDTLRLVARCALLGRPAAVVGDDGYLHLVRNTDQLAAIRG